jgi:small subunit ribosomal protein S16
VVPPRTTDTEVKVLSVKIRLARAGAKKAPFYRIVVADSRAPRDGRFIEILGRYNPRTDPSTIEVDVEKAEAWIAKGAEMSETAAKLIAIAKNPEASAPVREAKASKKAAAKAAAAEAKAAEPAPVEAPVEQPAAAEAPAEETADVAEVVAETTEDAAADEEPAEAAESAEPAEEAVEESADEAVEAAAEDTDEAAE